VTSELQQNRYDRLIRRVGGLIGTGSKVSEVLTELFPMIDVETQAGELQLLKGTVLGMGSAQITGDANERARVQLFNPVGSGKIVTVTDVWITVTAAQGVFLARTTIVLSAGIGTQLARDTRQNLIDRPTAQMFTDSLVALTDANMQFSLLANAPLHVYSENGVMILAPGSGIEVGVQQVQTTIRITYLWRERVAEQSELDL